MRHLCFATAAPLPGTEPLQETFQSICQVERFSLAQVILVHEGETWSLHPQCLLPTEEAFLCLSLVS